MTPKEKIELMLKVYREKLETASQTPADHTACIQLEAKIGLLEDLYYYFLREEPEMYKITCFHCSLITEFHADDVKIHPNESETIKYVQCSNCPNIIILETTYPD